MKTDDSQRQRGKKPAAAKKMKKADSERESDSDSNSIAVSDSDEGSSSQKGKAKKPTGKKKLPINTKALVGGYTSPAESSSDESLHRSSTKKPKAGATPADQGSRASSSSSKKPKAGATPADQGSRAGSSKSGGSHASMSSGSSAAVAATNSAAAPADANGPCTYKVVASESASTAVASSAIAVEAAVGAFAGADEGGCWVSLKHEIRKLISQAAEPGLSQSDLRDFTVAVLISLLTDSWDFAVEMKVSLDIVVLTFLQCSFYFH
jgi:hypothetical protein